MLGLRHNKTYAMLNATAIILLYKTKIDEGVKLRTEIVSDETTVFQQRH